MSAVTGTATARAIRATASIISRAGAAPPAHRDDAAVRIAECGSDAGARRRNGRKTFGFEDAGARGVPRVRENENGRPFVQGAQPRCLLRSAAEYTMWVRP